jgi:hypothetical protein
MHRTWLLSCSITALLACQGRDAPSETASETSTETSDGEESTTGDSESSTTSDGSTSDDSTTDSSTDEDSTDEDSTTGDDEWLAACPNIAMPAMQATVDFVELDEASGMVHSRSQDLLWVHNDSGDSARLFALGLDGHRIATVELAGISATDWEDLAIGPGDWLYAGDIGDNAEARPSITIIRFPEPPDVVRFNVDPIVIADAEPIQLTYPDSPHNAETLLVDPITGDLFIVSKGAQTRLFRRPAPISAGELEELPTPTYPSSIATAGDISATGDFIAVRGYGDAYGWLRGMDQSVGEAMLAEPCTLSLADEMQGEILAFEPAGTGYFTLSEGTNQPLWWYAYQ